MVQIVNYYRLYCETESVYRYVWAEEIPTVCPSGISHAVQSGTVSIIKTIQNEEINAHIVEEEIITGGHYQSKNVLLSVSGGDIGDVSITWPYPISLLSAQYVTESGSTGDTIRVCVGKDTVVGTITASVSGGQSEIEVSQSVIDNVKVGYYVNITDGSNVNELGVVIAVNLSSIIVNTPAVVSFSEMSPTYVRQTVCMVQPDSPVVEHIEVRLGHTKIGTSHIPVNTPLTFHYENNGNVLRNILVILEYLY